MKATEKYGFTIKMVKSWSGKHWAVVDSDGFTVTTENKVAQFPYNKEGLAEARKVYAALKAV